MSDLKTNIICNKSLTVTNLCDKNINEDLIITGFDGKNIYKSYLYFDLESIEQKNITVKSCTLRLYLQSAKSCLPYIKLWIKPIEESFTKYTTFQNQPKCYNTNVIIKIKNSFPKWIDININKIFFAWQREFIKNHGLAIVTEENKKSIMSICSCLNSDRELVPKLCIKYSPINCDSNKNCIDIIEKYWELNFCYNSSTPIINVESIIEGSFFIHNCSSNAIKSIAKVSGDGFHWITDNEKTINPYSTKIQVLKYYAKYYRIYLVSSGAGKVNIKFIYQSYKTGIRHT